MNVCNFKIVISSYKTSYKITAKKLIESLVENNNFPKSQILLVVGGYENKLETNFLDVQTIYVDHNSYDHTGLIEIIEGNHQSEFWFSTHDTCIAGDNFINFIKNFNYKKDYTSMTDMGWLNMGMFHKNYLKRNSEYILSMKNCSKIRAILSERVFTRLEDYDYYIKDFECIRSLENQNIYKDNKKRNVLYFKDIDLYKYQSYEALNIMKPNFTENKMDLM